MIKISGVSLVVLAPSSSSEEWVDSDNDLPSSVEPEWLRQEYLATKQTDREGQRNKNMELSRSHQGDQWPEWKLSKNLIFESQWGREVKADHERPGVIIQFGEEKSLWSNCHRQLPRLGLCRSSPHWFWLYLLFRHFSGWRDCGSAE